MDATRVGNRYLGILYHYIRPPKPCDPFPRVLGTRVDEFRRQVRMLSEQYEPIRLDDARRFACEPAGLGTTREAVLVTLDDGLSDQHLAAQILHEHGIQGVFFVPTCIFVDQEPASPTIIHYCIAIDGISGFLESHRRAVAACGLPVDDYAVPFRKGTDDPWAAITQIKRLFKYRLGYANARRVLLHIYRDSLLPRWPDMLSIMHLTPEQLHDMVRMGHAIGAHTRSHFSVASNPLADGLFHKEMIEPRRYLEQTFHVPVNTFSYPFGGERDCLAEQDLLERTTEYDLAFTVHRILNTKHTPRVGLGRYAVHSTDDVCVLRQNLTKIARGERQGL